MKAKPDLSLKKCNSTSLLSAKPYEEDQTESIVGTEDYISPEAIASSSKVTFSADLWSLGVIVCQIFSKNNETPFSAESEAETFEKIRAVDYQMPEDIPAVAADLISKLLVRDPTKRLGAKNFADLASHPFFEGVNLESIFDPVCCPAPLLPRQKKLSMQQKQELKFLPKSNLLKAPCATASCVTPVTKMSMNFVSHSTCSTASSIYEEEKISEVENTKQANQSSESDQSATDNMYSKYSHQLDYEVEDVMFSIRTKKRSYYVMKPERELFLFKDGSWAYFNPATQELKAHI